MTRQQFIESTWKPYPTVRGSDGESFFLGRVIEILDEALVLKEESKKITWLLSNSSTTYHTQWGVAIDPSWLCVGDVVAAAKQGGGVFLLSPCLESDHSDRCSMDKSWSDFIDEIRTFFKEHHFTEIHTPYLVTSPGVDHHIDFLSVVASRSGRKWCLPTSPEIELKKRLCQGHHRIFEIKKCFRDDLESDLHSVEFTMLEWYSSFTDLNDLAKQVQDLLHHFDKSLILKTSSLPDVFFEKTAVALTDQTSSEDLRNLCHRLNIDSDLDDDWDTLFFRVFMEVIEPSLGQDGPELLFHFPASQASLSQLNAQGWCERFELYWDGVELANAFLEVNDPVENKRRFEEQVKKRQQRGVLPAPLDESFFKALNHGMPPATGIAVGIDRLFKRLCR